MGSRLKPAVKWMDDKGKEVAREKATHALVTTYDKDGNVEDETFGSFEPEVADQS